MNIDDNQDDRIEYQIKNMLENVLGEEKIDESAFYTLTLSENITNYSSTELNPKIKRAFTAKEGTMKNNLSQLNESKNRSEIIQNLNNPERVFINNYPLVENNFNFQQYPVNNYGVGPVEYKLNVILDNGNTNNNNEQPVNFYQNYYNNPSPNLESNTSKFHLNFNNNNNLNYRSPNISLNNSFNHYSKTPSPKVVDRTNIRINSPQVFNAPGSPYQMNSMNFSQNKPNCNSFVSTRSLNNSSSSINSQEINSMTQNKRKSLPDQQITLIHNELDVILENNGNNFEKIDEEIYSSLKGNFIKLITTQNGSRIFQKSLRKTSSHIISLIMNEIQSRIHELMIDSYANYFCPKFYAYLDHDEKLDFLRNINDHILEIANNKVGTYPLQAILEQLITDNEKDIVIETLKMKAMDMLYHSQGVHVLEKAIICFEDEKLQFLYDIALENFLKLANNNNGLCIVKKVIIHVKNQDTLKKILQKIIDNCYILIQNPFGNYAIQTAVDVWSEENFMPIIRQFFNKFPNLSMQKFSSNVVEKFLEKEEVSINNRIVDLMKNNYGNYVVQKALKLANDKNKYKLIDIIVRNLDKIGDKKLISKWKSIVQSRIEENDEMGISILKKVNSENNYPEQEENNINIKRINSLNVPNTKNMYLDFRQKSPSNNLLQPTNIHINTFYNNISKFSNTNSINKSGD